MTPRRGPCPRLSVQRRRIQVRRHCGIRPREVGTDRRPMQTAVARHVQALVREIQALRILRRERERQRPRAAVQTRMSERRVDRARLLRAQIQPVDAAAVHEIGIQRVGCDHVALAAGNQFVELGHRDAVAGDRPARQHHGAGVLLRAVDVVRKPAVGRHVIDLRGRLVEPGTPGLAAVQRDQHALIDAEDPPIRVGRIDPQRMEIVAGRIAAFGQRTSCRRRPSAARSYSSPRRDPHSKDRR